MPKIIGQQEQLRALKKIGNTLKELAVTNKFLEASNPKGIYTITFAGENGVKYTSKIFVENKEDVNRLVQNYKDQVKTHIIDLADENRIALDPEDMQVLGGPTT